MNFLAAKFKQLVQQSYHSAFFNVTRFYRTNRTTKISVVAVTVRAVVATVGSVINTR